MTSQEIFKDFHQTLETWNQILSGYSLSQLLTNPGPEEWSTGEICMHLSNEALKFNIPQIRICLKDISNSEKGKTVEGEAIFTANSFPDKRITFPAAGKPTMPLNTEEVLQFFSTIKEQCADLEPSIESNRLQGKTLHPGFGWLNALEWYRFMEMHFRHHFRQESRIKAYLISKSIH